MSVNYYKLMEEELDSLAGRPQLLLHSCCGPCSGSVMQMMAEHFDITVYYYNPNIYPREEYEKRLVNQQKLLGKMFPGGTVGILIPRYNHGNFLKDVKSLETELEGGARCERCFEIRLAQTAYAAREGGFEYFTTTLSVSPHKNAEVINNIGLKLSEEYRVKFLMSDFKKRDGYKRSIELSEKYGIYRQNYCGCEFSVNV